MTRPETLLVLNAGSSSLKYQVVELPSGKVLLGDHVERVARDGWGDTLQQVVAAVE
ncbi:MAG: acetate kinase, partial [Verrucomicrobiaceae bacterium]